uniref:Uncharacterized protein n=1 Tax=Arundo donax TaxID=35708 RepID=A0A0A9H5M6_ARUDO
MGAFFEISTRLLSFHRYLPALISYSSALALIRLQI